VLTGYSDRVGRLRNWGFDHWRGHKMYLSSTAPRAHPSIRWVPGALSIGVKKPTHKADHPSPFNAEIMNVWSYTSTFRLYLWRGAYLSTRIVLFPFLLLTTFCCSASKPPSRLVTYAAAETTLITRVPEKLLVLKGVSCIKWVRW
jgi:hypothetical protein